MCNNRMKTMLNRYIPEFNCHIFRTEILFELKSFINFESQSTWILKLFDSTSKSLSLPVLYDLEVDRDQLRLSNPKR